MTPPDKEYSFYTIREPTEASLRERGSRFFSFAFPVRSTDEIDTHLAVLRRRYPDATHHCYAWMLGTDAGEFKANDDGEPRHSAGDPILGQIRSRGLTNTLVVVVRYFGGTKLGVGGLVQAYRSSAKEVLMRSIVVRVEESIEVFLEYDFELASPAMALIRKLGITSLVQQSGEETSRIKGRCRRIQESDFVRQVEIIAAQYPGQRFAGGLVKSDK